MITMLARCGAVPMDHYRLLQRDKISSSTVLQIRHSSGTFDVPQTQKAKIDGASACSVLGQEATL